MIISCGCTYAAFKSSHTIHGVSILAHGDSAQGNKAAAGSNPIQRSLVKVCMSCKVGPTPLSAASHRRWHCHCFSIYQHRPYFATAAAFAHPLDLAIRSPWPPPAPARRSEVYYQRVKEYVNSGSFAYQTNIFEQQRVCEATLVSARSHTWLYSCNSAALNPSASCTIPIVRRRAFDHSRCAAIHLAHPAEPH